MVLHYRTRSLRRAFRHIGLELIRKFTNFRTFYNINTGIRRSLLCAWINTPRSLRRQPAYWHADHRPQRLAEVPLGAVKVSRLRFRRRRGVEGNEICFVWCRWLKLGQAWWDEEFAAQTSIAPVAHLDENGLSNRYRLVRINRKRCDTF